MVAGSRAQGCGTLQFRSLSRTNLNTPIKVAPEQELVTTDCFLSRWMCCSTPFEDYRIELIGESAASSVTMNYATKQWMARIEILGEDATLIADLEAMSLVKYRRKGLRPAESGQLLKNLAVNGLRYATGSLRSTHDFIIDGFADSIINGTKSPVSGEEGRESVRVQNMIVEKLNASLDATNGHKPAKRMVDESHCRTAIGR
jgi:hypothetical protein